MNQKGFVNIALVVLVVILAGTAGYFALRKPTAEKINSAVNNEQSTQVLPTTSQTNTSEWKIYTGDNFSVKYPANIFTMFDVRKYSGAQYKRKLTEVELISSSRASNIGKKECAFSGLLGEVSSNQLCELGRESGISFTETDGPISDYTSLIEGDGGVKTTVTIGEKQFVKSSREFPDCTYPKDANGEEQKVCTDGTELDIYYIALNANRTLMIFRNVQGGHYYPKQLDGFPQQSLFDQVLSTLVIK